MKKLVFFIFLVILGILGRTVWHIGVNVEFVSMGAILAGFYLGRRYSVLAPFLVMMITDKIIGNSNIYLFTWSGYILIGLGASLGKSLFQRMEGRRKILAGLGGGVLASVFFYLWSNFGVWFLDSWGMYSRDLGGLFNCYYMGLPFLKNNLLGNLLFVPGGVVAVEVGKEVLEKLSASIVLGEKLN